MSKRIPVLLGLILMGVAIWMLVMPSSSVQQFIERLDSLGYDLQLRTRVLTTHVVPNTPIAIIDMDDKSLNAEGRWPWPRSKIARLVDQMQKQGAAVIAFDVFFAEQEINIAEKLLEELNKGKTLPTQLATILKQSIPLFDEDQIFAQSLSSTQSLLALGFLYRSQTQNMLPPPVLSLSKEEKDELQIYQMLGFISNIPILQKAAKNGGFINIFPDTDGIIRRSPLLLEYNGGLYASLSLQAVMIFLSEKIDLVTPEYHKTRQLEGIKLGSVIIPTDAKGQVLIPFIGKSYTFPYYSATDVLHNRIPKDALLGKILFIGTSATASGDLKATAIQNPFPGVEIQATLTHGLLLNNFSYKPAWTFGAQLFLTLLLGLIASLLFPHFGPRTLSAIIIFVPISLFIINNYIWQKTGLILSVLIPVLLILVIASLNIIYGYLFETRRRERLKEMFGQYVPEKHIDEMLRTSSNYALGGEDREMSVLFADIRNFTSISENLSAKELVELLNTFFTPMTEIIFKNSGTIDKYVGDLIMAFWGAPLRDKNHAQHALESALQMQSKVKELQEIFLHHNLPEIKIGIGINSGLMSVGDMGSRFRRNYTVLGDAVNLASRVEGLTKHYGVDIIVTEYTQHFQPKFVFRKLDRVKVKGKKNAITIYEVVCLQSKITPEITEELNLYHQALNDYFAQKWDEALKIMIQLANAYPKKKIYPLYIERINEFKQHPLPPDWNGVSEHRVK